MDSRAGALGLLLLAWTAGPGAGGAPPPSATPGGPAGAARPAGLALPGVPAAVSPSGESAAADTVWRALAARVREELRHAWRGYRAHAWGHDALRPLSLRPHDWYGTSLYVTPVDAFDTLLLMGLEDEAEAAKELVLRNLSFDRDVVVQVFEVNIRLLGGLLAAYQLDGDRRWLELARDLGDRLLPAFDSPTGMPYVRVNLATGETEGRVNNPAEIGTLMLEMGTLSRLTGDPRYYEAAERGVTAVYERRSRIGLVGMTIDVETGRWRDSISHVGGRIDSYYEYLLKSWLLFGDPDFRRMWEAGIAAVNRHLADERGESLWYGASDMATGRRTETRFGALEAFLPGLLALAGDTARGARLQESVLRMWRLHGVEPERIDYSTMEVVSPGYPLRPEALESAYLLWRLTGDERHREAGREMFEALVRWCRTPQAYAALEDVRSKRKADEMPSFFLAETLKYAWLLFSPPETLALRTAADRGDGGAVVFNTEAHPLRRTWSRDGEPSPPGGIGGGPAP